ncbi:MAG: YdcF family protein [Lachnospiraceae bacterium]|nr:YdcF family protein [Lachnospiraceae bacterium]
MQVFLWITLAVLLLYAVFAFLYTTVVIYASGTATSFLWFWPVTFFIALAAAIGLFLVLTGKLPRLKTVAAGFSVMFWVLMAAFLMVEALIFSAGRKTPESAAEYVVVLGAQVRGETPTLVLNARIKAAAEYLKEHPNAIVIASGGQGSGESISEAEAIKRGLVRLGIDEERILLEDESTSTAENLRFSAEIIRKAEWSENGTCIKQPEECTAVEEGKIFFVPEKVVLVTNDFHVFRATHLAENLGYSQVSGLGSEEFFAVTIQYYVREFFAVGKELLQGNF